MKNSFVAFFDILGFKNMVEKNSHEELMEAYQFGLYDSLENAEEATNLFLSMITPPEELETLKIQIYVISDSIIFIQDTLTQRGLLYIISYCRMLIGSCLADGIPIRGALSFGPVSVENKRGTTIVGKGLTKAYNLESKQQWAGGIVDKECFEIVPKENEDLINHLINNKKNPIITKYNVPQKDGSEKEELAMDWTIYELLKNPEDIRKAFSKHNKEINDDVEIKIENTIKFFNSLKK
ncbi:hypothetical protein [Flavobacterium sandaracinum]|uniref:Guanylate cyclase domain-containing protein n=1 Tax=Flavobacterium sandaracinum TaxID=2541733 RepID=A0A4R5D317_9FLAO|nr:hypothetical protein [Flavobacterium sandaracinum]TDE07732.1 hypothetical protein E0F91_01195 [Flavobacterium sandaracinum]